MNIEKIFKDKKFSIIITLLCMFLWGSAFPVIKISYRELGITGEDIYTKILFAGVRFFCSGLLVIGIHKMLKKEFPKFRSVPMNHIIILGLLQTTIQYFFYNIGLGKTTAVKAAILQASSTFILVFLAHVLLENDQLTMRKLSAVVVGFIGIVIANMTKGLDFSFHMMGEGFLLTSAFVDSLGSIYVKKYCKDDDPFVLTAGQMLIGSSILIFFGFMNKEHSFEITKLGVVLFIYSCFISSVAFLLWYFLLKYQKAGELSVYKLFIPVSGSLLSILFIGEVFTMQLFVGLVLVVAGIYILNKPNKK